MTCHGQRLRTSSARTLSIVVLALATFLLGLVSAPAQAQDLQNDDLLVGAGLGTTFGPGVIWRLRAGALDDFCDSTARSFGTPTQVMVDSQAQVVFVAPMQSSNLNFPHWGLFRCKALGAAPDLLAVFPGIGTVNPGDPVPFPGQTFDAVAGLHLARAVAGTINDLTNGGAPQVSIEDVYVLVIGQFDTTLGQRVAVKTVRYHTTSGLWDEGPVPCEPADCPGVFGGLPDAINHGGTTYFATPSGTLRRIKDPLSLNISGAIGGLSFSLQLSLFGGTNQISFPTKLDYVNLSHVPSGCLPNPPASNDMPLGQVGSSASPGFAVMGGFTDVVFDEWTGLGLVLGSSEVGTGSPFPANVNEALLDKPGDPSQYFQNGNNGCQIEPALKAKFIIPFFGPSSINVAGSLVSAPSGLAGTAPTSNQVVRLVPGKNLLQILADRSTFPALFTPVGLGAFPATASASGVTIAIRLDSPITALVTGPDGRRIGVDPSTGTAVNDFGGDGFDSGPGEPRFFAIRNAASGSYGVQVAGTGSGPYALHVYSIDPSQSAGQHIETTGAAAPGSASKADFTLGAKGAISFVAPPQLPVLTISANNASRQYGAADPAFTVSYSGFVNGDTPAVLTGTLTCSSTDAVASPIGVYAINCSGLTSANYAITFTPGALTVTPAPLTIAANNASRPYGANNPAFAGTVAGLLNADPISAMFAAPAMPASVVGVYPIVPTPVGAPNVLNNYAISLVSGTLTVVPEATSITVAFAPLTIMVGQSTTATVTLTAPDMVIAIDPSVLSPITLASPVVSDMFTNNGACTPSPSATPGLASCTVTVTSVEPNGRTLNAAFAGSADLSASSGVGDLIVTAALLSQQVCIASDFRNVAVPGGSYIWFNSIFKVRDATRQIMHVSFFNSNVQFQYTDATGNVVTVNQKFPDAGITIDPNATSASTAFDSVNNAWVTTIPWDLDDNSFLTGLPWVVPPDALPADVEPVTMCGTFASDVANIDIGWRWAAAAYSSFGNDNTTLGVKPMDTDHDNPGTNRDRAGTPENYKQFVIPGARGKGGKNYTGSYSRSAVIE